MKRIKIVLLTFLLIFFNLITIKTVFAQIDPSCDPNISVDTDYFYGSICSNLENLEYCNYGCPDDYRCDFVVVDEPTLNRCYCHCYPDLGTITPTPPSGVTCCNPLTPCPTGSGLVCEGFSMDCAQRPDYSIPPNLCVRDVLPTPVPGSGCNYEECKTDANCDQTSDCICSGATQYTRGACSPPFCGKWLHPCCDPPDRCQNDLVPFEIVIDPNIPIILCVCIKDLSINFSLPPHSPDTRMLCTPQGQPDNSGIDTAIGCIPIQDMGGSFGFIYTVLKLSIGISGGTAFILIVVSGFMLITSSGDPRRLQAGKELLTAAISGILFLILSVFMLRTIGISILNLPGF